MEKIIIDKRMFSLPGTQTILGTHLDGKNNFMALEWMTRTNYNPPMLGIGVNRRNASHDAIAATGEFSINIPSVDMLKITDYCGLVSGARVDKSGLFEVFYGELRHAPMIKDCPLNIECKVVEKAALPTNTFYIAEVVNIYSEERYLEGGEVDIKRIRPFLLTMPDNRYWSIGEAIGKAWNDGKNLKDKEG